MPRALLSVVAVAGVAMLAACSSGGDGGASSTPPTTAPVSTAVSTPTPVTTPPAPTTSAPSSTSSPSSPSVSPSTSTSTAQAQPRSTCSSLQTRVLRGSGVTGREFAAIQFTNTGSSSCTLYGYPTVTLTKGGKAIGAASQPASDALSTRTLAPGATAESVLNDYVMNCNADLSDGVTVVAPGSDIHYSRPEFAIRACTLRTGKLGEPE